MPDCLCTAEEARNSDQWKESGWVTRNITLPRYHPGAHFEFRTKNTYSSGPDTFHGQQCTYDEQGNLITGGRGAGTPDFVSLEHSFRGHQRYDVYPANYLDWTVYNTYWPPNQGTDDCSSNIV